MKKILFLCALPCLLFSQGTWTQRANLPDNLCGSAGFSIGANGYLGLGFNPMYVKKFYRYDTTMNSWTQIATFPGLANCYSEGFSVNGFGYLALGQNMGTAVKQVWQYSPATNTWTQLPDFPGLAKTEAVSFVINNKVYIGTGSAGNPAGLQKDFYEFDPATGIWTQKANFAGGRIMGATGFAIGNKGYVCMGIDTTFLLPVKKIWEYDPVADSWTPKADFPGTGRKRASSFVINGRAFVGAGYDYSVCTNDFYEFSPSTNTWTPIASLSNLPRQIAVAFSIGNNGYVGTGGNMGSPYYNDFWRYAAFTPVTPTLSTGLATNAPARFCNVFPNPATTQLSIPCFETLKEAVLINILGQIIPLRLSGERLELEGIESGLYYLKLTGRDNTVHVEEVVIRR